MKKIINAPTTYVEDMLKGIYAAHGDKVKFSFCCLHSLFSLSSSGLIPN